MLTDPFDCLPPARINPWAGRASCPRSAVSKNSPEETPNPRRDSKKSWRYHAFCCLWCISSPGFLVVSSWVFWGIHGLCDWSAGKCKHKSCRRNQSYIRKGIWRQGIVRLFCKEFLCFNTIPCRHMPLLVHFWISGEGQRIDRPPFLPRPCTCKWDVSPWSARRQSNIPQFGRLSDTPAVGPKRCGSAPVGLFGGRLRTSRSPWVGSSSCACFIPIHYVC